MAAKIFIDPADATWRRIETWAQTRLEELRKRNDTQQPEGPTAHLRGQITFAKELLALATAPPRVDDAPDA